MSYSPCPTCWLAGALEQSNLIWPDQVVSAVVAGRPAPCPMSRALQNLPSPVGLVQITSDNDHTANAIQIGPSRWNQLYGIDSESKMITYF